MKDTELLQLIVGRIQAAGGDQLAAGRAHAHKVEAALILAALEAEGWSQQNAARRLGLGTTSSLQSALLRKHPEIEAERQRRKANY